MCLIITLPLNIVPLLPRMHYSVLILNKHCRVANSWSMFSVNIQFSDITNDMNAYYRQKFQTELIDIS